MTVLPNGQTRLLARFGGSFCGATDYGFGIHAHPVFSAPPHPPSKKTRAPGGKPEGETGRECHFLAGGVWRVFLKPVQTPPKTLETRMALRLEGARLFPRLHGSAVLLHGFVIFCTLSFLRFFCDLCLSLSLLPMKRERERAKKGTNLAARVLGAEKIGSSGFEEKNLQTRAMRGSTKKSKLIKINKLASPCTESTCTERNAYGVPLRFWFYLRVYPNKFRLFGVRNER